MQAYINICHILLKICRYTFINPQSNGIKKLLSGGSASFITDVYSRSRCCEGLISPTTGNAAQQKISQLSAFSRNCPLVKNTILSKTTSHLGARPSAMSGLMQ